MFKDTKKAAYPNQKNAANIKDLQLTFYTNNPVKANVYTTDEVIAECSGYGLKAIKNMIYLHKKDIVKQHIATLIELEVPYNVIKAILGDGVVAVVIPEKDKRHKGA